MCVYVPYITASHHEFTLTHFTKDEKGKEIYSCMKCELCIRKFCLGERKRVRKKRIWKNDDVASGNKKEWEEKVDIYNEGTTTK
jgi:Zn-finger protein